MRTGSAEAARGGGSDGGVAAGLGRLASVGSVVGAVSIWSTSFVATKVAFAEIPPLTVGALRFLLAACLLVAVAAASGVLRGPGAADAGRLALGGLLGVTLFFSLENYGLMLANASDAALLVASYPAITLLLEAAIFRSRVPALRLSGAILAMTGVYLVVSAGAAAGGGPGSERLLGDLILVAAGVVWAFYNFVTRSVVNRYPMLTVLSYQTAVGAAAFVPLALLEAGQWRMPSAGSLLIVAYLGVFCSLLAFFLYARGLKGLDAGSAVGLLNLVPVFGVALAVIVLGEPLGPWQVLGGLVVIVGVMLGLRVAPSDGSRGDGVQGSEG